MKHKLLSVAALGMAMFVSTSAQAWDFPKMPATPAPPAQYSGEWATPEVGGQYYIYNVGAGLFLGGGQTWGTRGIVLCDSVVVLDQEPVAINNVSDNTTANYVLPFELVAAPFDETLFNINVLNNSKASSNAGHFVGEDGAQTWIDGTESRNTSWGTWSITETEGGWLIQNDYATNTKYVDVPVAFGVDGNNTASDWATTWTDLVVEPTEETTTRPWIVWQFVSAENGEDVRAYSKLFKEAAASEEYLAQVAAFQQAMVVYRAKLTLKSYLEEADEYGVDTSAAAAVYQNENATEEEVIEATNKLRTAIKRLDYDFSGASEDNPLDVTDQVLVNPSFDGNIDGWTITVGGQNLMYQSRTDGVVDESKNWVAISGFIEAWTPAPGALGDGTISQTIYALPAGKYVLECDAMATLQGGSPNSEDAVTGAYIFIKGDEQEVREPIKAPDTQPKHWSVTFVTEGSDVMTFGLLVENTTANWISADNFRLWYYGETTQTAAQAVLSEAIRSAQAAIEANEEQYLSSNADIKAALESAIAEAQPLTSNGSDEDCAAALAQVKEARAAYDQSVAEYKELYAFLQDQMPYYEEISASWGELNDEIYDLAEELEEAYNNGTATSEQIQEAMTSLLPKIREYIKNGGIKPGDDITILLDNPDFETGSTADPTGWTINSGSLTELRAATGNIEVYHKTFDISQTITNMPAGAYDITVQGFVRHDGAVDNGTQFYAGDITTSLMSLYDQWSLEPVWLETTDERPAKGDSNHDLTLTTPNGDLGYRCNGMTGAYYWFQTPIVDATDFKAEPQPGDNFYTNHIKAVLTQPGDFTIGLRSSTDSDWVIWDNFQITYLGDDLASYYAMIDDAYKTLTNVAQSENAFITKEGQDKLDAISAQVDDKSNITTGEEALKLITEINAVADYITEGNQKGDVLRNTYGLYSENFTDVEIQDENWYIYLEEVGTKLGEPTTISDNAAIDELVAELKTKWPAAVLYGAEEEPAEKFDATAVIYNPDFDNYYLDIDVASSYEGWTIENIGGAFAADFQEMECYNNDTIYVYQDIQGLKAGIYEVSVQGYYRAGFPASITAETEAEAADSISALYTAQNTYVLATSSIGEVSVPLKNAMADAQEWSIGAGSESEVITAIDAAPVYIPNNMEAARTYFDNDLYVNSLLVQVGEDGKLRLAISKWNHIEGDWTIFDNWKLYYLGQTGANFPEADAIADVKTAAAAAAQIFGIDGRQQSTLRQGINIVRTQDGSVRKVLVK